MLRFTWSVTANEPYDLRRFSTIRIGQGKLLMGGLLKSTQNFREEHKERQRRVDSRRRTANGRQEVQKCSPLPGAHLTEDRALPRLPGRTGYQCLPESPLRE